MTREEAINFLNTDDYESKGFSSRLVDADVIDDNIYDLTRGTDLNYSQISDVVDNVPTIIEANQKGR